MESLTPQLLNTLAQQANQDASHRVLQNVVANNALSNLTVNRQVYQSYQHFYNVHTSPEVKVTDQKSSGRCWLFAALNVVRRSMIRKYGVDGFEFSQSYLFFYDKLERLNYGLSAIIETREESLDSRVVSHLLHDPTCDGGQWDMFCNLVEKYGLVPKTEYRETHHSSNSREMNSVLTTLFREYALRIRSATDPVAVRQEAMAKIYQVLCRFLGTPPTQFTWKYQDKVNQTHQISHVTPLEFYRNHVPWSTHDYVCLVHDPRNTYEQLYTVKYLGNVVEGTPIRYLNLPIERLKQLALSSLQDNQPVWFGCDVMKHFHRGECSMDLSLVDYHDLLGYRSTQNKADRLRSGESLMTHAMVFTGARTESVNNCVTNTSGNSKITDWQVENSWSDKGPQKGFYNMSDPWFTEYVYEVVVAKSRLSESEQQQLTSETVTELPPWDPMGALASGDSRPC